MVHTGKKVDVQGYFRYQYTSRCKSAGEHDIDQHQNVMHQYAPVWCIQVSIISARI